MDVVLNDARPWVIVIGELSPRELEWDVAESVRVENRGSQEALRRAVAGSRFVAVGMNAKIEPRIGPATQVIDGGATVVRGSSMASSGESAREYL